MAASTLLSNPNRHRVPIHPTHQSANTNPVESNNKRNDKRNDNSKDPDKENIDISDLLIQTLFSPVSPHCLGIAVRTTFDVGEVSLCSMMLVWAYH